MKRKAVFPGQYIQEQGVINELPELIKLFGTKGLILTSKTVKDKILPRFASEEINKSIPIELFNGESSESELSRFSDIIRTKNIDVLVGMGGGKAIDTAKIAADRAGIPCIIIPTIASTDAPCSGCAVVYSDDGIFEAVHYQKRNPAVVLVDLNIIANSPTRFLVSGMGDALATYFETRSCERTQSMNECGGLSTLVGLSIAKLCFDSLLQYGYSAKIANEAKVVTPAFSYIVETNILMSGIGFESSGLAAAHSIYNGLTALNEANQYYHGEKVAFGTLAGLHLTGADTDEIDLVYEFCESVGLPTTLDEIGLKNIDRNRLMIAAEKASLPNQQIHHEAGKITAEKVLNSMIMADSYGKSRKKILLK